MTYLGRHGTGRLFPDLPAFEADEGFLFALGRTGGLCDCGDADDDDASLGTEAAGWPFFGQFVAHDITADRSALIAGISADPARLRNARSPQLNLECLYGDGPVGHPYLFRREDPAKLLTSPDGFDVLRNAEGTAIIGDPRNDSHTVMSQMHLAFVHAHNAFVDHVRAHGPLAPDIFETAARELRWHYQTVVLREFLPGLVGRELVDLLLAGDRRYYTPSGNPFIPLEFADAAYRYGHAQIRHTYRLNDAAPAVPIFPDLIGFAADNAGAPRAMGAAVRRGRPAVGSPGEKDRRHAGWRADRATRDTDRRICSSRNFTRSRCAISSAASALGCPRAKPSRATWA